MRTPEVRLFSRGVLVSEFEDVVFVLKVGEMSEDLSVTEFSVRSQSATAIPITAGESGVRGFCADSSDSL